MQAFSRERFVGPEWFLKGNQLSTLVHLIVDINWALEKENYNVNFLLDERSLAILHTATQKRKEN